MEVPGSPASGPWRRGRAGEQENSRRRRVRPFDDASPALDRFGAVLALTVVSIVTLSLIGVGPDGTGSAGAASTVVVTVLVGATLILALRASGLARRWVHVADGLVTLSTLAAISAIVVDALTPGRLESTDGVGPVVWMVLSGLTPAAVVRRLLRHREVGLRTVTGAIAVYLLLPITFFFLFLGVEATQGDFFGRPEGTTTFMYFSLATITTTGYGDLTPVTPLGRLLASAEALTGQLFLVTFVALLVGLFGQRWRAGPTASGGSRGEAPEK
ncbi:potassium channel family protein [Modestobacter sp. SSW1-42]|uniref:potassium channel family protein n=1 Tax=Modestobacter sp. SSW1-42 TaxID=596372 RepID=UPI003987DBAE